MGRRRAVLGQSTVAHEFTRLKIFTPVRLHGFGKLDGVFRCFACGTIKCIHPCLDPKVKPLLASSSRSFIIPAVLDLDAVVVASRPSLGQLPPLPMRDVAPKNPGPMEA